MKIIPLFRSSPRMTRFICYDSQDALKACSQLEDGGRPCELRDLLSLIISYAPVKQPPSAHAEYLPGWVKHPLPGFTTVSLHPCDHLAVSFTAQDVLPPSVSANLRLVTADVPTLPSLSTHHANGVPWRFWYNASGRFVRSSTSSTMKILAENHAIASIFKGSEWMAMNCIARPLTIASRDHEIVAIHFEVRVPIECTMKVYGSRLESAPTSVHIAPLNVVVESHLGVHDVRGPDAEQISCEICDKYEENCAVGAHNKVRPIEVYPKAAMTYRNPPNRRPTGT